MAADKPCSQLQPSLPTGRDHRLNRQKSKQLLKGLHSNPDPQNEQAQQMKKFINVRKIHLTLGTDSFLYVRKTFFFAIRKKKTTDLLTFVDFR